MSYYNIEWSSVGITPCNFITSKPLDKGIVRKYASASEKHRIHNMVINNVKPVSIENVPIFDGNRIIYIFSNIPIYIENKQADNGISTWELHSDDGKGHFIVRLYRELGYVELEVIEELNFLC